MTRRASLLPLVLAATVRCGRAGWIDEDTPPRLRTATSLVDGSTYHLVMSDEFNVPNRTFADGDDPTWTALDKSDDDYSAAGGGSLHFYNSSTVRTTPDGFLTIRSLIEKTEWTQHDDTTGKWKQETKHFKSGMIQSWNKFCFTGGIVEVDVVLPGEPDIGGLWPAIWMLGNLGRATYMGSTNMLWPWSYDKCDRKKQESQVISGCNTANHFGLNKEQGRGATEIDIIELMAGNSEGETLPETYPPISLPYVDMTLQVAPGIADNRPQSGSQPVRSIDRSHSGFATSVAENWYDNLTVAGNTSLNPFFYGTYLGVTKPKEPVTRNKNQVFQADAVGAMKQIVPEHFKTPHTFRVEWQPGRGGSLDWFTKSHREVDRDGNVIHVEGDGMGQEWEHSLSIPDSALDDAMGSKIPEEPSYLIFNTAISSTWGFPYDVPDWCPKCYDCDNPKCRCSFNPGFCNMMKTGKVALKIDSVRVYQSKDDTAHAGQPHTVGCDPPEFPTKEYIKGMEYKYMRSPPFSNDDKHPLRKLRDGGGECVVDEDCGGGSAALNSGVDEGWVMPEEEHAEDVLDLDDDDGGAEAVAGSGRENQSPLAYIGKNKKKDTQQRPVERRLTNVQSAHDQSATKARGSSTKKGDDPLEGLDKPQVSEEALEDDKVDTKVLTSNPDGKPKGQCVSAAGGGLFGSSAASSTGMRCQCNEGYAGPHCLAGVKHDDGPGAYELQKLSALFSSRAAPHLTRLHVLIGCVLSGSFLIALAADIGRKRRKERREMEMMRFKS